MTHFADPSNINFSNPVVVDFESYYDKEWSLSKITTEKYIRGDKWECIGLSIKVGDAPTKFYKTEHGLEVLRNIKAMIPNSPFISHNNMFDMGILGLRYGIHPKFMIDTAIMAKLCGLDRVAGGASLAKLSAQGVKQGFVRQEKGHEVHNMIGIHAADMTEAQWLSYGEYCKTDSDNAYDLYMYMLQFFDINGDRHDLISVSELVMADLTTKMWTRPAIDVDVPLLENYAIQLADEREALLKGIAKDLGFNSPEDLLPHLRSSSKFTNMLERLGVAVPQKWSEKQNKYIPATSKTDLEFLELLDHEDGRVRELVGAKLGAMSSMEQTRTATFLDVASRGLMPVPLRYASAHTGRYGGADNLNFQNLSKRTKEPVLRRSLKAIHNHVWVAADSSQIEARLLAYCANQTDVVAVFTSGRDVYIDMASKIYKRSYEEIYEISKANPTKEGKLMRNIAKAVVLGCIAKDTEVLCKRGWVAIQDIQDSDLLWDGNSWVTHSGVVPTGTKECIVFNDIYLTPDHKIFDGKIWGEAQNANSTKATEWAYWNLPDTE